MSQVKMHLRYNPELITQEIYDEFKKLDTINNLPIAERKALRMHLAKLISLPNNLRSLGNHGALTRKLWEAHYFLKTALERKNALENESLSERSRAMHGDEIVIIGRISTDFRVGLRGKRGSFSRY